MDETNSWNSENDRNELIQNFIESNLSENEKTNELLKLLVIGNENIKETVQRGMIGLLLHNQKLNDELKADNRRLELELKKVSTILEQKLKLEQEAEQRRLKWKARKRLPKRDPITKEIYDFLIVEAESNGGRNYSRCRLRLALCLLQITGVRVSELLSIKVKDVEKLYDGWIAIDRKKGGPKRHKAFLNRNGKALLRDRRPDFEFICFSKTRESYVFTGENSDTPLVRHLFTNTINKFLKKCSSKIPGNPNLKTHSFRIGYITSLWRDTDDIEFVKQTIGHRKLDTTSRYVAELSDDERKEGILNLDSDDD